MKGTSRSIYSTYDLAFYHCSLKQRKKENGMFIIHLITCM